MPPVAPEEEDEMDNTPVRTPSKPMAPNPNSTVKKRHFENSSKNENKDNGDNQAVSSFNPPSKRV